MLADKSPVMGNRVLAGRLDPLDVRRAAMTAVRPAATCQQAAEASQGTGYMDVTNAIDCNGLSAAPTLLRIKQALVGLVDHALPLEILVDEGCDQERLRRSLGRHGGAVRLISRPQ
ncbi:hypothetical protein OA90_07280 [Labrenzia sp. OB1]|nr:hypothetical protein OA90_07280 [Labrenzia sp. OB1]